jgi:hypothetical protein
MICILKYFFHDGVSVHLFPFAVISYLEEGLKIGQKVSLIICMAQRSWWESIRSDLQNYSDLDNELLQKKEMLAGLPCDLLLNLYIRTYVCLVICFCRSLWNVH